METQASASSEQIIEASKEMSNGLKRRELLGKQVSKGEQSSYEYLGGCACGGRLRRARNALLRQGKSLGRAGFQSKGNLGRILVGPGCAQAPLCQILLCMSCTRNQVR